MSNADLIHELTSRWNAGDVEGVLELYAEDATTRTGEHWPEQATYAGKDAIRASMEEWRDSWEVTLAEVGSLEEYGDKVVVSGAWRMRGRASGVDGEMASFIVFTVRDGMIAGLDWYPDRASAVAAARGGLTPG